MLMEVALGAELRLPKLRVAPKVDAPVAGDQVAVLGTRLSEVSARLSGLHARVKDLESAEDLAGALAVLAGQVQVLQGQIVPRQAQNQQLKVLQGQMAKLKDQLAQMQALPGHVAQIEGRMVQMQAQLAQHAVLLAQHAADQTQGLRQIKGLREKVDRLNAALGRERKVRAAVQDRLERVMHASIKAVSDPRVRTVVVAEPSLEDKLIEVAKAHGLTVEAIIGSGRHECIRAARHDFISWAQRQGHSMGAIGRTMGCRSGQTVFQMVTRFKQASA
jgi:DNA repair exonuclease SbcCD ATPase subunit